MSKRDKIEREISFKSIYSGGQETYELSHDEDLTSAKCPIDGTSLVSFSATTARIFEEKTMYKCPNRGNDYYHTESEKLKHSKEIIIQERKKRLVELRANESRIVSLLKAAGEKV